MVLGFVFIHEHSGTSNNVYKRQPVAENDEQNMSHRKPEFQVYFPLFLGALPAGVFFAGALPLTGGTFLVLVEGFAVFAPMPFALPETFTGAGGEEAVLLF